MRKVDADVLCVEDSCICSVTIARSKFKQYVADLRVFAERTFWKEENVRSYYKTLVYLDLSIRERTTRMYGRKVLKMLWDDFLSIGCKFKYRKDG